MISTFLMMEIEFDFDYYDDLYHHLKSMDLIEYCVLVLAMKNSKNKIIKRTNKTFRRIFTHLVLLSFDEIRTKSSLLSVNIIKSLDSSREFCFGGSLLILVLLTVGLLSVFFSLLSLSLLRFVVKNPILKRKTKI